MTGRVAPRVLAISRPGLAEVFAYVEAGINWRDPNAVKELANKVYLCCAQPRSSTTTTSASTY